MAVNILYVMFVTNTGITDISTQSWDGKLSGSHQHVDMLKC